MATRLTTIAIVEDDQGVRTALEQLLRSAGYKVRSFASAEEFLQAGLGGDVDCLVADINLPGITGVALVQRLAVEGGGLPAVIMTGRDDLNTITLIRQAGPIPCLRKPFTDDDLFDAIQSAMAA
ncbi:MAG: Transcriptional regulatory protein zraR [Gemmatimonadetes bacterium]|jgi:FixJ family two-component response regulator|nr:Transcriptional regulatory protein zraR [Gemmatimonadota bacterium]